MTAGRIGASGVEARHRGVRISRRAMLGSTIAIAGLAVVLAMAPWLVATSGRQPATDPAPATAPAVAAPAPTAPAVAVPAATPAATAEWPVLVVPRDSGPTGPGRAPTDLTPGHRWSGRSWGLYMD